ncbi:ECF transporter S component [Ruminococcus sp. MCC718]|jgi:uncharacterized membrane protein|nr:ECF transporter S component [Lachnospiraceae bacterium]MBT9652197.1 ECF transporter S component [Ruminococcus sp. MCC718]HAJ40348.1 ECF transporter S component [Lachnospiraceae bacterium]
MKEKSMNEKKSTNWTAKKLAINALAIALVCVSTMVIQIPIPLGYMHLGNCCILLVSVYFGNMTGMLAGGIGSCLADLLSGYTQWIIPTLIIKGIMGLVIAMIAYREGEEIRMMRLRTFLGAAAGIVIMIAGYTFAGCFLYGGMAAGFAQIPGLTTEGVIGLLLFYVIGFAFEKAKIPVFIKRLA